jgi:hypothetical protein
LGIVYGFPGTVNGQAARLDRDPGEIVGLELRVAPPHWEDRRSAYWHQLGCVGKAAPERLEHLPPD